MRSLTAPLLIACGLFGACSDDDGAAKENTEPPITLPHFYDLTSAPKPIQTAAKAVVRLNTARTAGTGAFISATGLLLTNNHVLGNTVCPAEGCYVHVSALHQRGEKAGFPEYCRAVPVAIDAGLDIAVLQLFVEFSDEKQSTPNYLRFDEQQAAALLGQHITVVGHPLGALKKWTEGTVIDANGNWITSTNFALPGDSGSPLLNDDGKIVGILHSGPDSVDYITDQGLNVYFIGTASAPIQAALKAPLPATVVSIDDDMTEAEVVANECVLLNGLTYSVTVDGSLVSVLDVLGKACDAALNAPNFTSPEDLTEKLAPCINAQTWIDCGEYRTMAESCPSDTAAIASWRSRFLAVNALQMAMNGIPDYYSVGPAIARLAPNDAEGQAAGAKSLRRLLDDVNPALNFELAYYLARFGMDTYDGQSVSDYVTNYSETVGYEYGAKNIAFGAAWFASNKTITSKALLTLLNDLLTDPKVGIGDKLLIEDYLYELGQL